MKTYIKLIVSILILSLLVACKKKNEDPAPVTPGVQSLTFRMTPKVGNDTLDFSSAFVTENNERYTLSMFRYYMSDISLIKTDGSEIKIENKVFLINPNTSDYILGDVPAGDYKALRFSVGLNNVQNHVDPTTFPINHPLAIQSPAIHWSWNAGYIFLMIEGSCDTTATNIDPLTYGQYSHPMFFHIGMDPLLTKVEVANTSFSVTANQTNVVNIHSDINKLFKGIDLKTENASHTMGTMPLASKVAANIPSMFMIK